LAGTNFKPGATVKLTKSGKPDILPTADPVVENDHMITCTFALTSVRGRYNVVVTNADGQSATLANGFTIPFPNPPTFDTIAPTSAEAGNLVPVTITGHNFYEGAVPTLKSSGGYPDIVGTGVVLNADGTAADPATEMTATFDLSGAHWGYRNVEVMNDDGQTSSKTNSFRITQTVAPTLTTVSPSNGYVGNTVTLTGTGFGVTRADSVVKFNGTAATSYTSWSDTSIKCKVPTGATTGDVKVVACGLNSNGKPFTVNSTTPPVETDKPTWYLAEGTTDYGFGTYITIQNPNDDPVTANVTYMTKAGPRSRAALTLPAFSQTVINPLDDIGATDFSTKVVCQEDKTICVDRRMVWTGPGAPSSEGHSSVGVTAPAKTWYLAEGSSKWGFETWLLVQNPNASAAEVTITYMIEGQGPVKKVKSVPANSRASYSMETDIGQCDASIKVEANVPVIPERAMYRYNRREGHDSIGTTTPANDYYLAEGTTDWGFTTYVLVQNPQPEAATINITYMTPTGAVAQDAFTMGANSRKTINVNSVVSKKDLSIRVHGSLPIIAERAMYWGAGTPLGEACHDSIGMEAPHMTFYLPDGETYNGTETWTLVQNPNATAVSVEISYLAVDGKGNQTFTESIPANSRKSFNMGDKLPANRAGVLVKSKTAGKKIMVERSIYWNSRGGGTDTIGGYAD
ncbi:MAG: IPT/TIG domain-containing protein, partial [Candidatus Geothermincolia bacterium]